MANCRYISTAFWSDTKVVDDFTPEDRYMYIYCLTNPHTTLCGCYEISIKQISQETGYSAESVLKVIRRLDEIHQVLRYNAATKELLLLNWSKYNWTGSFKIDGTLRESINAVKCSSFRAYLAKLYNSRTSVTVPYDSARDSPPDEAPQPEVKPKEPKHKYGTYGWVRLTDAEHEKLLNDLGDAELNRCIAYVDESAQATGNKNKWKDWNLVLRKCSRNAWGVGQPQQRPAKAAERPSASANAMSDLALLHAQFSEEDST